LSSGGAGPAGLEWTFNYPGSGISRPYTSAEGFLSYSVNSWQSVVPASAEDLALPVGSFIPPKDGAVFCYDRGAIKAPATSSAKGKGPALGRGLTAPRTDVDPIIQVESLVIILELDQLASGSIVASPIPSDKFDFGY
jgi:hypothetical protein